MYRFRVLAVSATRYSQISFELLEFVKHAFNNFVADDLPRFVHHLGPRYSGSFQDPDLIKFLTYEASTSLNMFLSAVTSKSPETTPLLKIIREGFGVSESSIVFSLSPLSSLDQSDGNTAPSVNGQSRDLPSFRGRFRVTGDLVVVKLSCLDVALWRIGGAAIALRLVQLASVSACCFTYQALCRIQHDTDTP